MTQEEFEGWSTMRETQEVKHYLNELRENYSEQIHNLLTNCNDSKIIGLQGCRLQGMIVGLNSILELGWEDVGGEEDV